MPVKAAAEHQIIPVLFQRDPADGPGQLRDILLIKRVGKKLADVAHDGMAGMAFTENGETHDLLAAASDQGLVSDVRSLVVAIIQIFEIAY